MFDRIQTIDIRMLRMIQRNFRCSLFDAMMPYISLVGNMGTMWATVMVVSFPMPHYREAGVVMFFVLTTCGVLTNFVLKSLVAWPGSCHTYPDRKLLVNQPTDHSFPPGHTISPLGAALIIFHANHALGIIAFTFTFLMASSRLYLFVHYPPDMLTGVVLGPSATSEPLVLTSVVLYVCVYCGKTHYRRGEGGTTAGTGESGNGQALFGIV